MDKLQCPLRQQPGLACDECRRRKSRCDRLKPQCTLCSQFGVDCVVTEKRLPRGPKKGQLKALRAQVAKLKSQLHELGEQGNTAAETCNQEGHSIPAPSTNGDDDSSDQIEETGNMPIENMDLHHSDNELDWDHEAMSMDDGVKYDTIITAPGWFTSSTVPTSMASSAPAFTALQSSDPLTIADLEQLYFERVHVNSPILHKSHYFTWAGADECALSPACRGLRLAVRALAAAASPQYRSLGDTFYKEAKCILEEVEAGSDCDMLEQIQAWLLIVQYECQRVSQRVAMITAGRPLRLIQVSRIWDLDRDYKPQQNNLPVMGHEVGLMLLDDMLVETEEKRRAFWLAYCWDRFFCIHSDEPLTLHEEMAYVRLPASENNFQHSRPDQPHFIHEALAGGLDTSATSPFVQTILMATLFSRCMSHQQKAIGMSVGHPDASYDFWEKHERLSLEVEKRRQAVAPESSLRTLALGEPTMAFLNLMAHTIDIYLGLTIDILPLKLVPFDHQFSAILCLQRASLAATQIARHAVSIPPVAYSKAHPFLPHTLAHAAKYLMAQPATSEISGLAPILSDTHEKNEYIKDLVEILGNLSSTNNTALDVFEHIRAQSTG